MSNIRATRNTVLKKQVLQSTELEPKDIHLVKKGKTYSVLSIGNAESDHLKVTLSYGAGTWYIYKPHWSVDGSQIETKSHQTNTFPSGIPKPVVSGNPNTTEVVESIVNYCLAVGITNRQHIAYVLSTAENESNFKPIREYRGRTLTSDQKRYWGSAYDGSQGYCGRGLVQLTHKSNYAKVGAKLGIDLVNNPNLMLEYDVSIATLVLGMKHGWFTGKKLTDYKPGEYWNQRQIVNPGEIRWRRYFHRAQKFVDSAFKWEGYLNKFAHIYPSIA